MADRKRVQMDEARQQVERVERIVAKQSDRIRTILGVLEAQVLKPWQALQINDLFKLLDFVCCQIQNFKVFEAVQRVTFKTDALDLRVLKHVRFRQ